MEAKEIIETAKKWQEEQEKRAVIVIAIENADDDKHHLCSITQGTGIDIIQALISAMKSDKDLKLMIGISQNLLLNEKLEEALKILKD